MTFRVLPRKRLWLRPMNGGDWLWAVGGLAAFGVLTGGIGAALRMLQDGKNLHRSGGVRAQNRSVSPIM